MGLFNKFKNILFEETEVDIPVITQEKQQEKVPERIAQQKEEAPVVRELPEKKTPEVSRETKETRAKLKTPPVPTVSKMMEINDFKAEPTFEFPVFDESDFSNTISKRKDSRNILEYEKSSKKRVNKVRVEEIEEVKTFKPSPIISPVYGVLDQNYKKEDIPPRKMAENAPKYRSKTDVDSIRNKAFGTLEDDINSITTEMEVTIEEDVTGNLPSKSIDELLAESEELETEAKVGSKRKTKEKVKPEVLKKEKLDEVLNALDEFEEDLERSRSRKRNLEEDTLETDLFNLIDSMYENKEKEE